MKLTAEQVRKLKPGTRVNLCGRDRRGFTTWLECTIVQSGKHKVFAYWDYYEGRKTKHIREYQGKWYEVEDEREREVCD